MASDFLRIFVPMIKVFQSASPDQLADLQDAIGKADGSTQEPAPYRGVGASGGGAERTISESSPDSNHGDNLTRAYSALAGLMTEQQQRQDKLEQSQSETAKALRSVAETLALMLGKALPSDGEDEADSDDGNKAETKNPDWQANGAKPKTNPDAEEVERVASKSLSEVFADLHAAAGGASRSTGHTGLTMPPSYAPAFAKARATGPTDEEIERMSTTDAVEALCQRQRAAHRARLGLA